MFCTGAVCTEKSSIPNNIYCNVLSMPDFFLYDKQEAGGWGGGNGGNFKRLPPHTNILYCSLFLRDLKKTILTQIFEDIFTSFLLYEKEKR